MYEILMVVYLVVALALIGFILIQQGKGAGMGASFGAGASGTVFGAGGSGNFLTKTTTILAIVFFGVALGLGNITIEKASTPAENDLFPVEATEQNTATDLPVESSDIPNDLSTETVLPTDNAADIPKETTTELQVEEKVEEKTKETENKN